MESNLSTEHHILNKPYFFSVPAFPTGIMAIRQTTTDIDFSWENTFGASLYFVGIRQTNGSMLEQKSTGISNANFTGLNSGIAYTGVFIANNYAGNGTEAVFESATGIELFGFEVAYVSKCVESLYGFCFNLFYCRAS